MKEGFFRNYELAQLSPLTRILFVGLWCLADKNGCLWDRPEQIKAECLPYDAQDVEILLTELNRSGFIFRYEVAGRRCIQVVNFEKHQVLTTWEKSTSAEVPLPKHFKRTSKRLQNEIEVLQDENDSRARDQNRTEQNSNDQNREPPFHGAEFTAALEDFKQHRTEKRAKLTPTAERNLFLKLSSMGELRATAALRHSMAQGWTGVFEENENGSHQGQAKQTASERRVDQLRANAEFLRSHSREHNR